MQGADGKRKSDGPDPQLAAKKANQASRSPCDWPLDELDLEKPAGPNGRAVLLVTGAMNPAHRGHVNMLHQARRRLEKAGVAVVGAFASPTHDGYVQRKAEQKGTIGLSGEFRVALVKQMVAKDPLVTASAWEVRRPGGFIDFPFPYVVDALAMELRDTPCTRDIACIYVCDPDLASTAVRHATANESVWGGVVVVPRTDFILNVTEEPERGVYIAEPDDTANFSSTELRAALEESDVRAVAEAMSDAGARFLLYPTTAEYARFQEDYRLLNVLITQARRPPIPQAVTEPLIYLSRKQVPVVEHLFPSLRDYTLPAWVPQRLIARDQRFDDTGMTNALKSTDGTPYLWATEFENVHDTWKYKEPELHIDGKEYTDSEAFYHAQKPEPLNEAEWEKLKEDVMRKAIRAKWARDPKVRALLCATKGHPLVAIKDDDYWGFHPTRGGKNVLPQLWMDLREEVCL